MSEGRAYINSPATPKIRNKRRMLEVFPPSKDSNHVLAKEDGWNPRDSSDYITSNSFDCQSLQRSLKRVRLSSQISPGELRLQRDLLHAEESGRWISLSTTTTPSSSSAAAPRRIHASNFHQDMNSVSPSKHNNRVGADRQQVHNGGRDCDGQLSRFFHYNLDRDDDDAREDHEQHWMIYPTESTPPVTVIRRPETDPLVLWLNIPTCSVAATVVYKWQFPRLYPHRPPTIRLHQQQRQQEQQTSQGVEWQSSRSLQLNGSPVSGNSAAHLFLPSINATNNNTTISYNAHSFPTCIWIAPTPSEDGTFSPGTYGWQDPASTCIVSQWTPLTRLCELVDMVLTAVLSPNAQAFAETAAPLSVPCMIQPRPMTSRYHMVETQDDIVSDRSCTNELPSPQVDPALLNGATVTDSDTSLMDDEIRGDYKDVEFVSGESNRHPSVTASKMMVFLDDQSRRMGFTNESKAEDDLDEADDGQTEQSDIDRRRYCWDEDDETDQDEEKKRDGSWDESTVETKNGGSSLLHGSWKRTLESWTSFATPPYDRFFPDNDNDDDNGSTAQTTITSDFEPSFAKSGASRWQGAANALYSMDLFNLPPRPVDDHATRPPNHIDTDHDGSSSSGGDKWAVHNRFNPNRFDQGYEKCQAMDTSK